MTQTRKLLEGVRVLDLSRVLAAPLATQMLGDLGAEVIKVERPQRGDDARHYGPAFLPSSPEGVKPESVFYLSANRNKKSITVDISSQDGQSIIRELAAKSDVLVENYKVGQLRKYALDYDTLKAENPRLIYCSLTGYGQTGPYADRPGYDGVFQAMGGLMSVTGHPDGAHGGGPMKVGPSIVDIIAGYNATIAILAALFHRGMSSQAGQHIDVGLLDSIIAAMSHYTTEYLVAGRVPARRGSQGNGGLPSDMFRCRDGAIFLTVGTDHQFAKFCEVIGSPELGKDDRYKTILGRSDNRETLSARILDVFSHMSVEEALSNLSAAGVPAGPVNDLSQVFADPQVRHREMAVRVQHPHSDHLTLVANPLRFSETPIAEYSPPPLLGQHTREILTNILSKDEATIARLQEQGAI